MVWAVGGGWEAAWFEDELAVESEIRDGVEIEVEEGLGTWITGKGFPHAKHDLLRHASEGGTSVQLTRGNRWW